MKICLQCVARRVVTPLRWRWALLMALASAWFAGCAAAPYYSGTAVQHLTAIPCDKDNCGKPAR